MITKNKNKLFGLLSLLCGIALAGHLCNGMAAAKPSGPYTVQNIKAYLYYSDLNTFSENVAENPAFRFWNVIIGEGTAKGDSDHTLVVIQVHGAPESYDDRRMVKVRVLQSELKFGKKPIVCPNCYAAPEGGYYFVPTRQILQKTLPTHILNTQGDYYCPLWLDNTGCDALTIEAQVVGQTPPSTKVYKTIPFKCGE